MMKHNYTEESEKWISAHSDADEKTLWLKYGREREFEIVQIECRRRFRSKLAATLTLCPRWLFPSVLSGEQSTGDRLAAFHARLVPECASMVDFTSGLGIDVLHCASVASEVTALELDSERAAILEENLRRAAVDNVRVECADCRTWLADYSGPRIDVAFIDPARRASDGGRVFALADCEPDVTAMLPALREKVGTLLLKMSPMLDISAVLQSLPECVRIFALGTATECKELLAVVDFEHPAVDCCDVGVEAVTIGADGAADTFRCTRGEEMEADAVYGCPRAGDWLCEPYPAVMKTGAVRLVAHRFGLQKLAPNTHVYFAPQRVAGFPGTQRRVAEVLPYASKVIKRFRRSYPRIDVATRNFGMSAEALRSRLGVRGGDGMRLLAVTDVAGERLLLVLESPLESHRQADRTQ